MTAETDEKLAGLLDDFAVTGDHGVLARYLREMHAETVGRLEHVDDNTHRLLQQVGTLLDELERFRPLLNMLRPAGTSAPDFISVGQTLRTARRAARNGRDKRG